MKHPKFLKVGANHIRVRYKHSVIGPDAKAAWGLWEPLANELYLSRDLKKQPGKRLVIMIHEVTHAIDDTQGLNLTEEQVTRLSEGLAAFLTDNGLVRHHE